MAPGEPGTFQTFADNKTGTPDRFLNRVMHGDFTSHASELIALNEKGAGIFWMVNAGDMRGRKSKNVIRVRAIFLDLDGAPLDPIHQTPLPPHCVIQSSPGRWHVYWRVAACPLQDFGRLQKALAKRYRGDTTVCDLPRVMRLPGFNHCKGTPTKSIIVSIDGTHAPYSPSDIIDALELTLSDEPTSIHRTLPRAIPLGQRNTTMLSLAAGLVRRGFQHKSVNQRLQRINSERCDPPLCKGEIEDVVTRAMGYGSSGFALIPHALIDSSQWKALPPATHEIILTAYRRYDGFNNGNIALPWSDFEGLPGFSAQATFYKHRRQAVESGILTVTKGRNRRVGKSPDLFAIAQPWVRTPTAKIEGGPMIKK